MADDIRGMAYAGGFDAVGSYGSGRYWIRWQERRNVQVQRFNDLEQAVEWYQRWKQQPGRVTACRAVREALA